MTTIARVTVIASVLPVNEDRERARKKNTLIVSERLATYATDSVCTGCSRNNAPAKIDKHLAQPTRLSYPAKDAARSSPPESH